MTKTLLELILDSATYCELLNNIIQFYSIESEM